MKTRRIAHSGTPVLVALSDLEAQVLSVMLEKELDSFNRIPPDSPAAVGLMFIIASMHRDLQEVIPR